MISIAVLVLIVVLAIGGYELGNWLFKVWAGGGMNKL